MSSGKNNCERIGARSQVQGATFIELAVALPIIALFLIGIVDLSRFVAVRAVLNRSAQGALEVAIRVKDFDTVVTTNSGEDWDNYSTALTTVRNTASRLATGTFLAPSSAPASRTVRLFPTTLFIGANTVQGTPSDVLVLRPGDYGIISGETINPVPLGAGQSLSQALKEEPIVIEMRARVRLFTPMLGTIQVVGRAVGYREMPPTVLQELADASSLGCGNGVVEASLGEQCDTGGPSATCNISCQSVICGNGIPELPEHCDPSEYAYDPAAWSRVCYPPGHPNACRQIGSSRRACTAAELADLSNPTPGSGCCGDNTLQNEQCDPTNAQSVTNSCAGSLTGSACGCSTANCTTTCAQGSSSCPPGFSISFVINQGCQCVQDVSVIN